MEAGVGGKKKRMICCFKSDLFEKQQRLLVPETQRQCSSPKMHNLNKNKNKYCH